MYFLIYAIEWYKRRFQPFYTYYIPCMYEDKKKEPISAEMALERLKEDCPSIVPTDKLK